MMAHWDVSSELRGEHGKWSKSGIVHRLAKEAATAGKSESGKFEEGHRVKYKTGALGTVHHVDEKGVPHVVWDRGRGKPVRTPAHHLEHHGEQVKPSKRPPGAIEHGPSAHTERESRIRDETLRKLSGRQPRGKPEQLSPKVQEHLQEVQRRAGEVTPEMRKMIADMEAKAKAEQERQNVAMHGTKNSVTEIKSIHAHPESQEYLAKLRGGGIQKTRSFEEVHAEYQAKSGTLQRAIDNPGRYRPGVIPANRRDLARLEGELRGMGARRTSGSKWEMPPKPGTPEHAQEKLDNELRSITEQLHDQHREAGAPLYSPQELADARRSDIASQIRSNQSTIVVKVPSGSEIQMSPATAKYLLYGEKAGHSTGKATPEQIREMQAQIRARESAPKESASVRRARQQARLAEAASRRGITNRRKAT